MKAPEGRPTIARRFNGGFASVSGVESRRDDRKRRSSLAPLGRPSGAFSLLPIGPTVETVGYSLPPLRGFSGTGPLACPAEAGRRRKREIDQQVYARYLPAPRLRQAGGLTPEEIKIVESASAEATARQGEAGK